MNKELLSRDRDADTRPEGRHWPAAEILCAERFPLFLASIGPRVCHEARRMCARFEAESTISGGYRLDAPGAAVTVLEMGVRTYALLECRTAVNSFMSKQQISRARTALAHSQVQ